MTFIEFKIYDLYQGDTSECGNSYMANYFYDRCI